VCAEPKQPHLACRACGAYNGRSYAEAVNTEHETR
jgi:large subunit ribosomal protein L32